MSFTPSRLVGSQTVPPQEPRANYRNHRTRISVHSMSGGYPEGQKVVSITWQYF